MSTAFGMNTMVELLPNGDSSTYGDVITNLQYIESTGTQWIDTKVFIGTKSIIEADIMPLGVNCFFGAGANWKQNEIGVWHRLVEYGNIFQSYNVSMNKRQKIKVANNGITFDGKQVWRPPTQNFTCGTTLAICSQHRAIGAGEHSSIRIYGFKITDNGKLIRDFIPVESSKNGAGLFDKVEKKFYGNSGTGSFVKGAKL